VQGCRSNLPGLGMSFRKAVICTALLLVARCAAFSPRLRSKGEDSGSLPARTTATIAGQEVRYVEINQGTNNGVSVVLLHGARFSVQTWVDLGTLLILQRHGVHAVAVDLPGYGQSRNGRKGSHGNALSKGEWLAQLLQQLVPRSRVVLVSPSMSGSYAVPYLQAHGDDGVVASWMPVAPTGIHPGIAFPEAAKSTVDVLCFYGENDPRLRDADILTVLFTSSRKVGHLFPSSHFLDLYFCFSQL